MPEITNPNIMRSLLQQSAQRLISTYDELIGTEKRVRLRVELDAEGRIVSLGMLERSGHAAVDTEALSIAARLRFRPAQRGGVTVNSTVVLPLHFVFPDD